MKKVFLITAMLLAANFLYSQANEKENKRIIKSYLSQAKNHARTSDRYIRIVGNPYGLIINPSYTDRVKIELPEYIKETKQAVICLNKALLIDPNNQAAKKLSIEINMKVALQMFKLGEDSYDTEQDVYFNRALEYFANAYVSGADSAFVFKYVHQIDSIENKQEEGNNFFEYVSIPDENLYKMSTAFQQKNTQQIDSLKKIIAANEHTADSQKLFNLYTQLLELEKYHFKDGKFQYHAYNNAFENKIDLAVELGSANAADYLDVYAQYREAWHGDYVTQRQLIAQIPSHRNAKVYDGADTHSVFKKDPDATYFIIDENGRFSAADSVYEKAPYVYYIGDKNGELSYVNGALSVLSGVSKRDPDAYFILNKNGELSAVYGNLKDSTVCRILRDTTLADGTLSHIYTVHAGSHRTSPVRWYYAQFLDGVDMLLPVSSNHSVEFAYPSGLEPGLHNFVDALTVETDAEGDNIIRKNMAYTPPPKPEPSFEERTAANIESVVRQNASQNERIRELEQQTVTDMGSAARRSERQEERIDELEREINRITTGNQYQDFRYSTDNSIDNLQREINSLKDEINSLRNELQRK
jgi:hypothetical protein